MVANDQNICPDRSGAGAGSGEKPPAPEAASAAGEPLALIVVDDERLALSDTLDCVAEADPAAVAHGFLSAEEALVWAGSHDVDLALLDIEMPGIGGIELARGLMRLQPSLRVVFVTSFESYALDAFGVHAQGYLLKPVDPADLARELAIAAEAKALAADAAASRAASRAVRGLAASPASPAGEKPAAPAAAPPVPAAAPVPQPAADPLLTAVTFGGFELYAGGRRLTFKRARAKELMALLVDRRGAGVALREAVATFWPDEPFDNAKRSYYQSMVSSLRQALAEAGAERVLVKSWNSLAVDPALIDCDLYRLLNGDPEAAKSYRHDYLPQYEWSEYTSAEIEARLGNGEKPGAADGARPADGVAGPEAARP